MLRWPLPYSNMSWPQAYMCPRPPEPFFHLPPHPSSRLSQSSAFGFPVSYIKNKQYTIIILQSCLLEVQCKSPSAKTKVCSVLWFFLWARGSSFLVFSSPYMVPTFLQSQLPSSKLQISNATSLWSFFHSHISLWLVTAVTGSLIIKSHVIPLGHLGEPRITVQSWVLDLSHMCKIPLATKRKLFTSCRDESVAVFQGLIILPTLGTFQG